MLELHETIIKSNKKSEENNLKFQAMILESKKSEENNSKKFQKYDKQILELRNKLNLITNENKDNEKKIKSVSYNSEKKKTSTSFPSINSNSSNN